MGILEALGRRRLPLTACQGWGDLVPRRCRWFFPQRRCETMARVSHALQAARNGCSCMHARGMYCMHCGVRTGDNILSRRPLAPFRADLERVELLRHPATIISTYHIIAAATPRPRSPCNLMACLSRAGSRTLTGTARCSQTALPRAGSRPPIRSRNMTTARRGAPFQILGLGTAG